MSMKQQTATATTTTADAAAICTAGGKKICDDRLPVLKSMQISGKRLLPRLSVSATISPIPQDRRTVDVQRQSQRTRSRQNRVKRASAAFDAATLGGRLPYCNNQSLIWLTGALSTLYPQVKA